MKKIIFAFLFTIISFFVEAQEDKFATRRAANAIDYISSNMDLSQSNIEFLKETLYNKYSTNASKIRGKDLTQDEKKSIYRAAYKETRQKLMSIFSNDQVNMITRLERESFKQ
jgi:hypothetical protein